MSLPLFDFMLPTDHLSIIFFINKIYFIKSLFRMYKTKNKINIYIQNQSFIKIKIFIKQIMNPKFR